MNDARPQICVAIDGGTTNTRARVFRGHDLMSVASRAVGARDAAIGRSNAPLRQAVSECVREAIRSVELSFGDVELFCASGMLTSNVGLRAVDHVIAPAGRHELARHVVLESFPDIAPEPIHLVPGIKTTAEAVTFDNLANCDVLRGEESEAVGAMELVGRTGPLCFMLPGSHTKLLHVDAESRITASYTTIAGEMTQALAQYTIVANSIDWPPAGDPDLAAVDRGIRFAREWGIGRGAFAVRLADMLAGTDRHYLNWFFLGLVVGNDWSELIRWKRCDTRIPLIIGGREPLRSLYGRLAESQWSSNVSVLDGSVADIATARGAIAIANLSRTILRP
jgi:2-dehydro-3-deoxygalactonokinase